MLKRMDSLVLILVAAAGTLLAQDAKSLELDRLLQSTQLGAASKRAQSLQDAPADVVILTHAELQALGYRTLGEALAGVAGFRTNNDGAYQNVGVRGIYVLGDQNTRMLVLLDGHTLNAPGDAGSSKFGEDLGIPLETIDHVEIIRGPASSLYGNNAFFGVVNVVSRDVAGRGLSGEGAVSGGSGGLGELWSRVGLGMDRVRGSLLLTGAQRKGFAQTYPDLQADAFPANLDREERQSGYLRLMGEKWSFSGYAGSRTQRLASAPFQSVVGDPRNQYRNRVAFGELKLEPTFGPVQVMLRLFGDRNWFSDAYIYDGVRSSSEGVFVDDNPERSLGLELQGRFPVATNFFVTLGSEQRKHRYEGLSGSGPYVRSSLGYNLANTYAQVEWLPAPAFSLVAGLQYSQWTVGKVQAEVGGDSTGLTSGGNQAHTTPRLSLIWQPAPSDTLKLLYSQGFRNATVFERYYSDLSSFLPNPALRAERMVTLQGLWLHEWQGGLQGQLSASRFAWSSLIQPMDAGDNFQQFQNQPGSTLGSAIEGELRWQGGAWNVYGQAGAYRWRMEGVDLVNVATAQASLRAIHRTGDWTEALEARYVGRRSNGEVQAPAATVTRASLRYDRRAFWLQVSLEDLFDTRRVELVARDYDPIQTMRGEGRALRATFGWKF
jgi:outer membrane receptor for ferrienterochelin and colicins